MSNRVQLILWCDVSLVILFYESLFFHLTYFLFCLIGHPWILFYTNPTLGPLTFGSRVQTCGNLTTQLLTDVLEMEYERTINTSFDDNSTSMFPNDIEEDEDCCMVDMLALAISRVRISEPKRSRICGPNDPVQQEHSANINIKSLCAAF